MWIYPFCSDHPTFVVMENALDGPFVLCCLWTLKKQNEKEKDQLALWEIMCYIQTKMEEARNAFIFNRVEWKYFRSAPELKFDHLLLSNTIDMAKERERERGEREREIVCA